MNQSLFKYLATYIIFVALFVIGRLVFMAVYHTTIAAEGAGDWLSVTAHGLPMDLCIAGYLTIVPGVLIIMRLWSGARWLKVAERVYFAIASLIIASIIGLDLVLYGYWGFRLDMTPLFYFTTSPVAAMASAPWWHIVLGVAAVIVVAALIYMVFRLTVLRVATKPLYHPVSATLVMLLLVGALFIPIRGGFTVSTMNLSRAYFSQNQRLNHAAINPALSLMYSATHQGNFASQYRFMDDAAARRLVMQLNTPAGPQQADSATVKLLNTPRPDIYLVILESFSSHLMPSLGGENVAVNLDSIAREGVSFTSFYANSFRTDRALPSILSAYPAQPSTSLMKYVEKTDALPSLPAELKKVGYDLAYYYGGDINFTNMLAYLINCGFEQIVCDKDFPLMERTGKWGAHDHLVLERAAADIASLKPGDRPQFKVVQTSSSHEPFEVPYASAAFAGSPQKNAFAYTDSCLRAFTDAVACSPRADRSLVIFVPDHYGAYPADIDDALQRHSIPLVMTGRALASRGVTVDTPASQIDLAATLLAAMGLDHSRLEFSKDIMDASQAHYAVFTEPSVIALVTDTDTVVYNCDAATPMVKAGPSADMLADQARAYLQNLYDNISNL